MAFCFAPRYCINPRWTPRSHSRIDRRLRKKERWHLSHRHLSLVNNSNSANFPGAIHQAESGNEGPEMSNTEEVRLAKVEDGKDAEPMSWGQRIRNWFKVDMSRVKNLGIGAILSYGFVSNVNSGICFTVAWLTHVKRTGMMPFAPGQWKGFLAVYAGLWALYSVLRPLRIAIAIALTPLVNQMMEYLVLKLNIERKQAFFLLLFTLAIFTISSFGMAVWILGGIPTNPPKTV